MIRNYIFSGFLLIVICLSCSKGNSNTTETELKKFNGFLDGRVSFEGDEEIQIEGNISIAENGDFILVDALGTLVGNATIINGTYDIVIGEGIGFYENLANAAGIIDVNGDQFTFTLLGYDEFGNPMGYYGDGEWWLNIEDYYRDNVLTKSAVIFSHYASCRATVTIDGVMIGPIDKHYHEGGLCSSYYPSGDYSVFNGNFEDDESELKCTPVHPIFGQQCYSASFYLESDKNYDYFVNWENGKTSAGSFQSLRGGYAKTICLENPGPDCNYSGQLGNPSFTLTWETNDNLDLVVNDPSGEGVSWFSPTSSSGGVMDINCDGNCEGGNIENVFWENGPYGNYLFFVSTYDGSGQDLDVTNVDYQITIRDEGEIKEVINGTVMEGLSSEGYHIYSRN